jgi:hypothetical protein
MCKVWSHCTGDWKVIQHIPIVSQKINYTEIIKQKMLYSGVLIIQPKLDKDWSDNWKCQIIQKINEKNEIKYQLGL